jgi:hypothetical protein
MKLLCYFSHISLLGSGISFGHNTSKIAVQVSFTMNGILFLDMWKSNSRSVDVIQDAKYLKKMTIIKHI